MKCLHLPSDHLGICTVFSECDQVSIARNHYATFVSHFESTNTTYGSFSKDKNQSTIDYLTKATHFFLDGRWQCSQKLRADFCNPWSSQYWCSGGGQTGGNGRTGRWSDAKLILQHFSTNVFRKCCKERGIYTLWQAYAYDYNALLLSWSFFKFVLKTQLMKWKAFSSTCKWVLLLIASRWEGLFLDGLRLAVSTITPGHRFPRWRDRSGAVNI